MSLQAPAASEGDLRPTDDVVGAFFVSALGRVAARCFVFLVARIAALAVRALTRARPSI